ncbi:MAG: GNAT family N-acetyltransferase [Clostridia bacterium]|nr:GNAT family N-acetyltransferase [Clostridia bacterium]
MIRREEFDFEQEILNDSHIAVPFQVTKKADGTLDLLVYSFAEKTAEEFERRFAADPFSEAAKAYLAEKLTPVMEEFEFDADTAMERVHLEYRCSAPDTAKILPDCELIDTLDGEEWDDLPLDEFDLDPKNPLDRMAVIRRDGKIVCFAGLNDISEEDGHLEVTVECEVDFRKQGFGVSCIAKITEYLLGLGEEVKYVCADDNFASAKTAESAGYGLYAACMPFVCYKFAEDEDEEFDEEDPE